VCVGVCGWVCVWCASLCGVCGYVVCALYGLSIDHVLVTNYIKFNLQLVSTYSTFPTLRPHIDSFRADNRDCTVHCSDKTVSYEVLT
jgi:hypothetical protein